MILHHSFLQSFLQHLIVLLQSVKFVLFAFDGFLKPVHVGLLLRAESLLRVPVLFTPFLSEVGLFLAGLPWSRMLRRALGNPLTSLRISSPMELDEMGLLTAGATGLGWFTICTEAGTSSKSPHDSVGGDANRLGEFKRGCA